MVKPAASKIRELARKKRSGTQEAEREAKKRRSAEEVSRDLEVGPSALEIVREKSPVEDPSVVLSLDSLTQEEETSTERTMVSPTLNMPIKETVALTKEPSVETVEAEHPTVAPTVGAPMVVPDGPSIILGSPAQSEQRAKVEDERERLKLLEKVGLSLEEFDGLFVSDEPRAVDLRPF